MIFFFSNEFFIFFFLPHWQANRHDSPRLFTVRLLLIQSRDFEAFPTLNTKRNFEIRLDFEAFHLSLSLSLRSFLSSSINLYHVSCSSFRNRSSSHRTFRDDFKSIFWPNSSVAASPLPVVGNPAPPLFKESDNPLKLSNAVVLFVRHCGW